MALKLQTAEQQMTDNVLVKHYAGSIAYGTNLPTSDVDYRGIFCANPVHVRTPFFPMHEVTDTSEEDTKSFELCKFMKLALDCNPNVIETLWVDLSDVVTSTPEYDMLRMRAGHLLSSKIAFTTSGYALSQLKRIKGHHKWINQPQPAEAPQQVDYVSLVHNFTPNKVFKVDLREYYEGHRLVPFSGDTYGMYETPGYRTFNSETGTLNTDYEGDTHNLGTPKFVVKFNRANYENMRDTWKNYWTWKNNRNAARGTLEEQFGYDTKHAMHCVRLLRMGAEALEQGVILVKRPDAQELLDIRAGKWTYEELVEYAEHMENHVRHVLLKTTHLPPKPNVKLAAELTLSIQNSVWERTK